MNKPLFSGRIYENIKDINSILELGEYEDCIFKNCNLSRFDLTNFEFSNCQFNDCDLSNCIIKQTAFRDIQFKNCKLLGLHFDDCHQFLFKISCNTCNISFSSFYQIKLKDTLFNHCILHETDFTETDLTKSKFNETDLMGAIFEGSILHHTDFQTAYHYQINLEKNYCKKTKFSESGLKGLLHSYDIEII